MNGPDFLCIGMQKAGTGWLYDQLQFHPDFWMLPINELHFFDWDFPHPTIRRILAQYRADPAAYARDRIRRKVRPIDRRDTIFFDRIEAQVGQPKNIAAYQSLFAGKGDLLSGDGTPGYSALDERQIAAIAKAMPGVKIVLLVREPISRAWSQMMMRFRRETLFNHHFASVDKFRPEFEVANVQSRSFPIRTLDRWANHFPAEQIGVYLLDDIIAEPDATRDAILRFLGATTTEFATPIPAAGFNRKANKNYDITMSQPIRDYMIGILGDEVRACATRLGGRAAAWPAKYQL